MKSILNLISICFVIILWGFALSGTISAHTNPQTVHRDDPMLLDEVVELKVPEKEVPEVPEIRLATFRDEFAVRPIVRELTEEEWKLLESIGIAEAGNQDAQGVALVMLTVLNRCEKNGTSVRATIFAPNQFYVAGMTGGNALSNEARELIRCGWDESQGCLYFCSTGWNHYGAEHLFKHGDHWFSR